MFRATTVILDPPPLPDRLTRRLAALDALVPLVERAVTVGEKAGRKKRHSGPNCSRK